MKALFKLFRRFDARRIFGFIRRLGGHVTSKSQVLRFAFYPRPPGGGRHPTWPYPENLFHISIHALRVEGDPALFRLPISFPNFYPRPPGGGRLFVILSGRSKALFLSTPSGWRATFMILSKSGFFCDFYPRPPGGGRLYRLSRTPPSQEFLSTPSGWRATALRPSSKAPRGYFYPRPPGGGRPFPLPAFYRFHKISIHALRVEGDWLMQRQKQRTM